MPKVSKSAKTAKQAGAAKSDKSVADRSSPTGIQKTVNAAPIPEDKKPEALGAKPPAPLELGGHEVRVGISGAIQADVIHDFNALGLSPGDGLAREFITANIPVGGAAADITNRTAFSPNQSYLAAGPRRIRPGDLSRFMRM
jgi:hypothetical protein